MVTVRLKPVGYNNNWKEIMKRLVKIGTLFKRKEDKKQAEINRLRKVLYDIVDTRPDEYMDIEETPELTEWICNTCTKAKVGTYPHKEHQDNKGLK